MNAATAAIGLALIALFVALMLKATASGTPTAYRYALAAATLAVAVMETRVRMGLRLPRGRLFYAHLVASVIALGLLIVLAFAVQSALLRGLALAFFAVSGAAGGVLLYRGVRAHAGLTYSRIGIGDTPSQTPDSVS